MTFNVKIEEEATFDNVLIDEGTLVEMVIGYEEIKDSTPQKSNHTDNMYVKWQLTVKDTEYSGKTLRDFIGTAGTDKFIQMGKTKMMYALEHGKKAHETGNYNVNSYVDFNGLKVVAKVGIDVYQKEDKTFGYKNVIRGYGSPRPDSGNHKIYEAWKAGNQPFRTKDRPPLPKAGVVSSANDDFSNHPAFATPMSGGVNL